jgi:hypothetical protein
MSTDTDVREKWKFSGRELVDGVPHLMWKFDDAQSKSRGRHRAEAPDWEWGCPVDDFKKVTIGSDREFRGRISDPHPVQNR